MSKYHILFVEDTDSHREYISETLQLVGYDVVGVKCAKDALQQLKYARYHVALIDIELILGDRHSGPALAKRIQESDPDQ